MKVRPLGSKVLVRRDPETDRTKGGIYIPDNAKQKLTRGVVLAVGRGRTTDRGLLIEPEVRVGDKVVFGKYSGSEIEQVEREQQVYMPEDDILAVIEEEDA